MRRILLSITIILFIFIYAGPALGGTYETTADNQNAGTSQETSSGYNYYDAKNNLVGYSERDGSGGYNYYDTSGNKISTIAPDNDGRYTVYDASGIKTGELENTPSKKYDYKQQYRGGITELDVLPADDNDVGALNPFLQENKK